MKKQVFIALSLVACSLFLSGCASLTGSSAITKIEKGMSKKEIVKLLGEPDFRRFDDQYEEWEYKKENVLTQETKIIIVDFVNDRVSHMNSFSGDIHPHPPVVVAPPAEIEYDYPHPRHPERRPDRHLSKAMDENDFRQLYNKVKQKPFKDDQLELLEIGISNRYVTCNQCIRLMSIYTFDDEKLKVLEIVAPNIIDAENYEDIIESLSFISSEEKAHKILREARR